MTKELITTSLSKIKPTEVRLQSWSTVLTKVFNNERLLLEKFKDFLEENNIEKAEDLSKFGVAKIAEIERIIAYAKKEGKLAQATRKEDFDLISKAEKRYMEIEKNWDAFATEAENKALLPLKRIEKEEKEKVAKRQKELQDFTYQRQRSYNDLASETKAFISSKVQEVYKNALSKDFSQIKTLDKLREIIEDFKSAAKANHAGFRCPQNKFQDPEFQKINDDIWSKWDEELYVNLFEISVDDAFENFESDQINKKEALEKASKESAEREEKRLAQLELANAAAKLDQVTSFVPDIPVEKTRKLEMVWRVKAQEETEMYMQKIWMAYFGNKHLVNKKYRGASLLDLTANKVLDIFASIKNEDNAFKPDGIEFEQVEKIMR